jgi:hypothetical protein
VEVHFDKRKVEQQGPGKVVTGVRLEMIGVDAPLLDGAGRA